MKHITINLTPAEAEALKRIVDNAAGVSSHWLRIQNGDWTAACAAERAANKLQDAMRNRTATQPAELAAKGGGQ